MVIPKRLWNIQNSCYWILQSKNRGGRYVELFIFLEEADKPNNNEVIAGPENNRKIYFYK